MTLRATCQNHRALVGPNKCRVCGGLFCVVCIESTDGRGYCPSHRLASGESKPETDDAKKWFTAWSFAFWAGGLAFLLAIVILVQSSVLDGVTDPDVKFEIAAYLGGTEVTLIIGGLVFAVVALNRATENRRLPVLAMILNVGNGIVALFGLSANWYQY